jgi:hypothetical protein
MTVGDSIENMMYNMMLNAIIEEKDNMTST